MAQVQTQARPVAQQEQKKAYAGFWLYRRRPNWYEIADVDWEKDKAASEAVLIDAPDDVTVRGTYSMVGLNAHADLMIWCVTLDLETMQDFAVRFGKSPLGQRLEMVHSYFGLGGMSLYEPDHSPAFVQGKDVKTYLSVYPFIKTPDWYLLPYEERRRLMKEHGEMGREYPTISTNTVNSFGLQDQEFIVALEDDDPQVLLQMVQALRAAEVRKYTKIDTPIFLGRLKAPSDAFEDLR